MGYEFVNVNETYELFIVSLGSSAYTNDTLECRL